MLLPILLMACGGDELPVSAPTAAATAAPAVVARVDAAALKSAMDADPDLFLLDVRTDREYSDYHIAGSTHIPMSELQQRMGELEPYRDRTIYVICAVGGRSSHVHRYLLDQGYGSAIDVTGGIKAWAQAGYPVERGS